MNYPEAEPRGILLIKKIPLFTSFPVSFLAGNLLNVWQIPDLRSAALHFVRNDGVWIVLLKMPHHGIRQTRGLLNNSHEPGGSRELYFVINLPSLQ